MPFESEAQRKYLWANEPEVAAKFARDKSMSARVEDINGWPEIKGNPISKVGVFPYSGRAIGLPGLDPDSMYNVYRPAEELSDQEAIDSFKLVPWIDEHTMLGEQFGTSAESKGIEGVIGEEVYFEYPYLKANIKLFSDSLYDSIEEGKRDLSLGYRCEYALESGEFDGQTYDVVQRRIRGNHVASVGEGRMGKDVAVLDEDEKLTFSIDSKEFAMADNEGKKKEGEDKGEKSLEGLYEMVGGMKDSIDAVTKDVAAMKKAAKDAEEEEGDKKDAKDSEEKEGEDKGAKDSAMDAMEKRFESLEDENKSLKQELANLKSAQDSAPTAEEIAKGMKARDALYNNLSRVTGAFDASEMTTEQQVAKYGVDKLGLDCVEGHEVTAINAYLKAAPKPQFIKHQAADGAESDGLDAYVNGNEE